MRLFWLGTAWLAGILIGQLTGLPGWFYLIGVGLGMAGYAAGSQPRVGPILALASLGALRLALSTPSIDDSHIASYNDLHRPIVVTGVVVDYPDVRDRYVGLRLEAEQLELVGSGGARPVEGLVLVQADRYRDYRYGDRLSVAGFLETPPEDEQFSYRDYLARQGVLSMLPRATVTRLDERQGNPLLQVVFGLREQALRTIHRLFPEPEASLLAGILLGIESGISPEVREAFNATSTTHIIAISGFNLTVLAALVIRLFGRWLGIRRGAIAAALTIGLYTLLVGADAAVVRAAIMGGLALFARFLGRRADALASLAAAAVLMTAVQPLVLWEVGFQLSFAATLGLVLYADPIQTRFVTLAARWMPAKRAERLAAPIGDYVLFTLAAQATTLPLTAAYFQRLSLSSLLANPIILPAQPPLMILGGLATISGMLMPSLGKLIALLAWPFPAFTIRAVSFFAEIPSSALTLGPVSPLTIALAYGLLFGATWLATLPADRRPALPRPSSAALVLGLAIVAGVTWREVATRPDGKTHLTFFNSGHTLIESPGGRFVLVGGGDSAVQLSQQLGRRMPLLHRHIDWLIVPDTSERHVRGLIDLTNRYQIRSALVPGPSGGFAYRAVLSQLQAAGVELVQPARGHALQLAADTRLVVLDRSETRLSLLLQDGHARIALLFDSEPLGDGSVSELRGSTVLVVHDPGASEWLSALRTWLPVATGHSRAPSAWPLRTEQHGWIEVVSDGQRLWVLSERPVIPDPLGTAGP